MSNASARAIRAIYGKERPRQTFATVIERIEMGETNINTGGGQVGAMGSRSKAQDVVQQRWHQHADSIDLKALAKELLALRTSMGRSTNKKSKRTHDKAIAEVGSAEKAARQNDGPSVFRHLKGAGKWALDAATKIGTAVAADAIKKANGI